MKNLIIIAFLFIGVLAKGQTGNIKVTIPSLKESKGDIILNLYNSANTFLEDDKHFRKVSIPARSSGSTFTFTDIPKGNYAILAHWDINSNGKLESNLLGIPKEEVGFSNNVFGSFGPPEFDDASFTISDKTTELTIIIKKVSHF